jgi:hypothetical protein
MQVAPAATGQSPRYELRFRSLSQDDRGYSFPCDRCGRVDLDALSERSRNDYFFARVVIGRELAAPVVHSLCCAPTNDAPSTQARRDTEIDWRIAAA